MRNHGFAGNWSLNAHLFVWRVYLHVTLASRPHWIRRLFASRNGDGGSASLRLGGFHLTGGWVSGAR